MTGSCLRLADGRNNVLSAVSSGRFRTQLAVIVITGSFKGLKDAVWLTDKILTADGWIWPKYHVRRSPAIDSRAFHIREFDFCNEAFLITKIHLWTSHNSNFFSVPRILNSSKRSVISGNVFMAGNFWTARMWF